MAVKTNICGTTCDEFQIGNDGPTIKQGDTIPVNSGSSNGDLYVQHAGGDNSQLFQRRRGTFRRQPQIFAHNYSTLTIVNDSTNNNIYNTQIPADWLQLDNVIIFRLFGTILNDTGASQQVRIRLRYDAQNLFSDFTNIPADPNPYSMEMEAVLVANESTAAQRGRLRLVMGEAGELVSPLIYANSGTSTVDSTANNQLRVQWRFTNASPQLSIEREAAYALFLSAE